MARQMPFAAVARIVDESPHALDTQIARTIKSYDHVASICTYHRKVFG